jgi:hypothetical protein
MDTHIMLKLVTSEIVVGRFDTESEDSYTLDYPMVINYTYDVHNSRTQIYLSSLNPFYTGETISTIHKRHVILKSNVDEDFITYYEKYVKRKQTKEADESTNFSDAYSDLEMLQAFEPTANTSIN